MAEFSKRKHGSEEQALGPGCRRYCRRRPVAHEEAGAEEGGSSGTAKAAATGWAGRAAPWPETTTTGAHARHRGAARERLAPPVPCPVSLRRWATWHGTMRGERRRRTAAAASAPVVAASGSRGRGRERWGERGRRGERGERREETRYFQMG